MCNKTKPAYKKYCSYCHRTNHSITACFKKQRDDEDRRDAYARSKSAQKSFVQYFRSSSNDKHQDTTPDQMNVQIDIAVKVHLVITIKEITIPIIDQDLHLELVTIIIEILLLHITLDHVMILINL